MKILVYSMNFWPEPTSTGKYSGEMAAWLAAQGHDIRVIAAPPYYPQWKVADGYSAARYRQEKFGDVDVRRCPVWIPAHPNGLKRIICMLFFGLTCTWEAIQSLFWRPDVVLVVEPPIACAPVALLLARIGRAKTWLHIQDFEVNAALQLGMLKLGILKRLAVGFERFVTKRFDRRSTISTRMMEKLAEKTADESRNILFPNWVDCGQISPLAMSSFRTDSGIPNEQNVALYAGNIGRKQGLEVVIEAARLLQAQSDITFVICGHGAAYSEIRDLAAEVTNIIWLPVQPSEKLNELLNLPDVHLLPQKAGAADLVMPSKLTGMLASGRAILATADEGTQVHEVVSSVGTVVSPERPELLASALVEMFRDRDKLQEMGRAGRELATTTLSKESILQAFEGQLMQLDSPV